MDRSRLSSDQRRSPGELVAIGSRMAPTEDVDATMRNHKLSALHGWLSANVPGYTGLYEAGSTTVGDPWVEGRSDRDIAIVFTGRLPGRLESLIRAQLPVLGFNDTYLFYLVPQARFPMTITDQDISMKFRGRALFGPDLLADKETPSREFAAEIASAGLRRLRYQVRTYLINAESWSLELLREKLYSAFKLLLMYLADRAYAETGHYPKRRIDVGRAYGSAEMVRIAQVTGRINRAERPELIATAMLARDVLRDALTDEFSGRAQSEGGSQQQGDPATARLRSGRTLGTGCAG